MSPLGSPPETAKEALAEWDNGSPVWTVEVSGMGPSYEQTIHITAFELIRTYLKSKKKLQGKELSEFLDKHIGLIDKEKDLGHSQASAGAAKHLAFSYLTLGYKNTIDAHRNKLSNIQVMKWFPRG